MVAVAPSTSMDNRPMKLRSNVDVVAVMEKYI
jgi:hypothetical protein